LNSNVFRSFAKLTVVNGRFCGSWGRWLRLESWAANFS
jgi:hypothetical protein